MLPREGAFNHLDAQVRAAARRLGFSADSEEVAMRVSSYDYTVVVSRAQPALAAITCCRCSAVIWWLPFPGDAYGPVPYEADHAAGCLVPLAMATRQAQDGR